MLRVEICCPDEIGWLDHDKNRIDKLVFSKEHHPVYKPGHYGLESFGSLYRNIDDFRKSPLQSLSDWEINLPSVFSSKDGSFKTIDLLYWLETVNQEFNLIGCEAVLYDGADAIFRCVVDSTVTGSRRSDIKFIESIGSPEIKASFFPTAVGGAAINKWQVLVERTPIGFQIEVTDQYLDSGPQFSIYLEKRNEYVPVEFCSDAGQIIYGSWPKGWQKLVLLFPRAEIDRFKSKGPFLYPDDPIHLGQLSVEHRPNSEAAQVLEKMRPSLEGEFPPPPEILLVNNASSISGFQHTAVEAWSDRLWNVPPQDSPLNYDNGWYYYALGRIGQEQIYDPNQTFSISRFTSTVNVQFAVKVPVESIVAMEAKYTFYAPAFTKGSPQALRDFSKKIKKLKEDDWSKVPTIALGKDGDVRIYASFPDLGLPSEAKVTGGKIHFQIRARSATIIFSINDQPAAAISARDGISWQSVDMDMDFANIAIPDFQKMRLTLIAGDKYAMDSAGGLVQIAGLRLELSVLLPLEKAQSLYASGTFITDTPQPGSDESGEADAGNSVVQSVKMLLNAANVQNCKVSSIGELNKAPYGTIMRGNSFLLRDKLRSLAAESGTSLRFSPAGNEIIAQSVSRMQEHESKEIPLSAFVLLNNMYSFKMESPYRSDIASGVVISWGRDQVTDKYAHTLEINSAGAYRDGTLWQLTDSRWNSVLEQLKKGLGTLKNLSTEWIMDWKGAEIMAYDYLCWNCAPLRKAEAECITSEIPEGVGLCSFVRFDLPGYPRKFAETVWVVTGIHDDLDGKTTTIELLEAWNMSAITPNRFLLLESGKNILLEDSEKIRLEVISNG
jgi:hypothetical protein